MPAAGTNACSCVIARRYTKFNTIVVRRLVGSKILYFESLRIPRASRGRCIDTPSCLTCALAQCSDTCSGIKAGRYFWHVFPPSHQTNMICDLWAQFHFLICVPTHVFPIKSTLVLPPDDSHKKYSKMIYNASLAVDQPSHMGTRPVKTSNKLLQYSGHKKKWKWLKTAARKENWWGLQSLVLIE